MLVKFAHITCERVPEQCNHLLEAVAVNTEDAAALELSVVHLVRRQIESYHPADSDTPFASLSRIQWEGQDEHMSMGLDFMEEEDFKNQFLMVKARGFRDILVVNYFVPRLLEDPYHVMGTTQLGAGLDQDGEHTAPLVDSDAPGGGDAMAVDDEQNGSVAESDERMVTAMEAGDDAADSHGNNSSDPGRSDTEWQHKLAATPPHASSHSKQSGETTLVLYGPEGQILAEMPVKNPTWLNTFVGKPTYRTIVRTLQHIAKDDIGAGLDSTRDHIHGFRLPNLDINVKACEESKAREWGGGSNGVSSKATHNRSKPAVSRLSEVGRGNRAIYRAGSVSIALRPSHSGSALKHTDGPVPSKWATGRSHSTSPAFEVSAEKSDPVCST